MTRTLLAAFLVAVVVALCGCASAESENASTRPWNSPKGWESGLPSGMTEGR